MKAAWIGACAILVAVGCGRGGDSAEPGPRNGTSPQPMKPVDESKPGAVVLTGPDGTELRIIVEVVRTPAERNRGLMDRDHLPADRGMLFIFDREEIQSFWMKNTMIPLDMIFIRKDMTIVGIVENAEPQTLTSRKVNAASTYVLEVNGGWSRDNGIGPGAAVAFENISY